MKQSKLRLTLGVAAALFVIGNVAVAQLPPAEPQPVVCGASVTGCLYTLADCGGFFAHHHGFSRVAAWSCNGNVANNYTCDSDLNGGCCTIPSNPDCPSPNCPGCLSAE